MDNARYDEMMRRLLPYMTVVLHGEKLPEGALVAGYQGKMWHIDETKADHMIGALAEQWGCTKKQAWERLIAGATKRD